MAAPEVIFFGCVWQLHYISSQISLFAKRRTLASVGVGSGESENGRLTAALMTISRGAAAPRRLPAATGRDRHVRDSPWMLGYARTLTAARHLHAQLFLRSASGELPRLGPLPRLEVHLFSHGHLPTCGALLFFAFGLRPWPRISASTCTTRPAGPHLGRRLVDAQIPPSCTLTAARHRAASEWPRPACSSI